MMTDEEMKKRYSYDADTGIVTIPERVGSKGRILPERAIGSNNGNGYLRANIDGKNYYIHRLAWFLHTGEHPKEEIDHINGDRKDNRFCNLRDAGRVQNSYNKGMNKNNTTGYKGVTFEKRRGKYIAQHSSNYGNKFLGYFATPEEASKVRDEYVKKTLGHGYADRDPAFIEG